MTMGARPLFKCCKVYLFSLFLISKQSTISSHSAPAPETILFHSDDDGKTSAVVTGPRRPCEYSRLAIIHSVESCASTLGIHHVDGMDLPGV